MMFSSSTIDDDRARLAEYWRYAGEASERLTDEQIVQALIACASAWEPQVRLLGNLRAGDIVRVLRRLVEEPTK
jgi:hypothetical protein